VDMVHRKNLARFRYRWERKVDNWRILLYLASCWNLWFKYSDFRKAIPQESDDFSAFFFTKVLCIWVTLDFFLVKRSWCSQLLRFLRGSCNNEVLQVHIIYWNILQTHNLLLFWSEKFWLIRLHLCFGMLEVWTSGRFHIFGMPLT
jgi:hypothetical protein